MRKSVRRLATAYRGAVVPGAGRQYAALIPPLAIFAFAETPAVWISAALLLGIFCYFRLDLGLRLIVLAIPFAFAYKHVGADIYSPPEILTIACFGAWAARRVRLSGTPGAKAPWLRMWKPPEGGWRWIKNAWRGLSAPDRGVLAFVCVALLSLVIAEDQGAAQWEVRILVIEPALVYWMVRGRVIPTKEANWFRGFSRLGWQQQKPAEASKPEERDASSRIDGANAGLLALADALTAGALLVAIIGLYQYFFTDYVESVQGVRRVLSIYDSPNHVSLFLGRVAPISFCLAAFGATRPGRAGWRRVYHAAALLPILLCLYLTYSRGAWLLGLPAALIFIGALRGRRARIVTAGALIAALLALAPVVRTPRIASLLTLESGTNAHRLLLWEGAGRMIAANPILGVGLGNFMRHYPRHMLREAGHEPVVFHPHNLLLDTWTSMGLAGVAALVFLLIAFFRAGLKTYRRLKPERELQALTLGLLASMVSFGAHGLVDTGFRLTDLAFVFMLTLGMMRQLTARDLPT